MQGYTAKDYRDTPSYFGAAGDAEKALRAIYAPDWTTRGGERARLAKRVRKGVATIAAIRNAARVARKEG